MARKKCCNLLFKKIDFENYISPRNSKNNVDKWNFVLEVKVTAETVNYPRRCVRQVVFCSLWRYTGCSDFEIHY